MYKIFISKIKIKNKNVQFKIIFIQDIQSIKQFVQMNYNHQNYLKGIRTEILTF